KLDERALDVGSGKLGGLKALHFFLPRSGLRGPGAGRKPLDKLVQLRDLLFTLGVAGLDARADLSLGEHHVVIAAGVSDDALIIDIRGVGADFVQEVAIV